MLVSMNWIQEFVDLGGLDIVRLIHRFTLSTAEVEEVTYKGKEITHVVAGKIIQVTKHPESKKLNVIKVDTGNRIYNCVCAPLIFMKAWWCHLPVRAEALRVWRLRGLII